MNTAITRRVRTALVLLLVTIGAAAASAQPFALPTGNPPAYRPDPVFHELPENIELLRLENGLQVVLIHNPAQPMVGVFTEVAVGSAWEEFRTSGMSHMLEHLLFNGTERFTQEELYDLADLHGIYNNANTSQYYTNFMMVSPAASIGTAMLLQSQMLFHSLVPADKFAKEQGIVLGELVAGRDTPGYFSELTLRDALYGGTSLGLPVLGTRSTIAYMSRDDVYDFYRSHYVPNNMITTVAGNFDRDEALALLERYYGGLQPGALPRHDTATPAAIDRTRTVVRRGGDRRLLALAFEAPGYGSPDYFAFLVMCDLLVAEGSGILTRAIEGMPADDRPALDIRWDRHPGTGRLVLEFELTPAGDPAQPYRVVQDACAAVLNVSITSEDVAEVVTMAEIQTMLHREQLRETAVYAAGDLVGGGVDFFATYLDRLRAVESADVAEALGEYVVDRPCLGVLIEPESAAEAAEPAIEMPEGMEIPPAMAAALAKMNAETTAAAKPAAAEVPEVDPTVVPQTRLDQLPIERSELANGTVLVSQTNEASPLMAIHFTTRNRAVVDNGFPGTLNLVHHLLQKGIGGCDETCLSHRLRSLGAVVKFVDNPAFPMDDYYTNGRFSFIRVQVAAENGPAVLDLLADMTQYASFGEEDFEQIRRSVTERLERDKVSARALADRIEDEMLLGDHPLVRPAEGDAATLAAASYDDARTIYRRAFAPQNLLISVVSPLSHADLAERIETLLPGRGETAAGLPPLPVTTAAADTTVAFGGEVGAVRLGSVLTVAPQDRKALELLVAVLSDRLAMDLREARGLSYSVGASIAVHGESGRFSAWINPPRERLAEGATALRQAIAAFDPALVTQAEVDKIRAARRGRFMLRRLSSLSQAYYLAMYELDGDVSLYDRMLTGYDDLTLADLARVGRQYLSGLPLVSVVVD